MNTSGTLKLDGDGNFNVTALGASLSDSAAGTVSVTLSGSEGSDTVNISNTGSGVLDIDSGNFDGVDTIVLGGTGDINVTAHDALSITTGAGNTSVTMDTGGEVDLYAAAMVEGSTLTAHGTEGSIVVSHLGGDLDNFAKNLSVSLAAGNHTITSSTDITVHGGDAGNSDLLTIAGIGDKTIDGLRANLYLGASNIGTTDVTTSTDSLSIDINAAAGALTVNAAALDSVSTLSLSGGLLSSTVTINGLSGILDASKTNDKDELASILDVQLASNQSNDVSILTGNNATTVSGGPAGNVFVNAGGMASDQTLTLSLTSTPATVYVNGNLDAIMSSADLAVTVTRQADNTQSLNIVSGSGNDTLLLTGPANVTGGDGADLFSVLSGTVTVNDLGQGADDLQNFGGTVSATLLSDWVASASSQLVSGTTAIDVDGHGLDLSAITAFNVSVTNSAGSADIVGSKGADSLAAGSYGDTLQGGLGSDTLIGGAGQDTFIVDYGKDTVQKLSGTDVMKVYGGAEVSASLSGNWTADSTTFNNGTATIAANGFTVNLQASGGTKGYTIANGGSAASLTGSDNADSITAGAGGDTLVGGHGADTLTGGNGKDVFLFQKGDSVLTASGTSYTGFDVIKSFTKGGSSSGDAIAYEGTLYIGGTSSTALADSASINQSTGIATFAAGSGGNLLDAVSDVATRIGSSSAGGFAFFKVGGSGSYYMFISDGSTGVTSDDVLIQLNGITSFSSLSLVSIDETYNKAFIA
jgi:Ca2+-binding RTX toxin-like protein